MLVPKRGRGVNVSPEKRASVKNSPEKGLGVNVSP